MQPGSACNAQRSRTVASISSKFTIMQRVQRTAVPHIPPGMEQAISFPQPPQEHRSGTSPCSCGHKCVVTEVFASYKRRVQRTTVPLARHSQRYFARFHSLRYRAERIKYTDLHDAPRLSTSSLRHRFINVPTQELRKATPYVAPALWACDALHSIPLQRVQRTTVPLQDQQDEKLWEINRATLHVLRKGSKRLGLVKS